MSTAPKAHIHTIREYAIACVYVYDFWLFNNADRQLPMLRWVLSIVYFTPDVLPCATLGVQ